MGSTVKLYAPGGKSRKKSLPVGISPTGAPFAYIVGAAPKTKPWPLGESHPRKNQTRAVPGAIGGICAWEVVTFACGEQSASTRRHATSSSATGRAYLLMPIL